MRVFLAAIAFALLGCASTADTRFWLENMVVFHRYSDAEVATVLGVAADDVPRLLARYGIDRDAPVPESPERLRVLPYPGGRHPRIGFLEGAVAPQRGTKCSVFAPWDPTSYVVVDLPEAIWWQRDGKPELLYLAHEHIPTHWSKAGVELPPIDWTRRADGGLEFERRLPNGIVFGACVVPGRERAEMLLYIENGSDARLTGLRAQVCVLLGGARGFSAQTSENKSSIPGAVQCVAGDRAIGTGWDGGRVWHNPRCPCMHSDPSFSDLDPGERAEKRGFVGFVPTSLIQNLPPKRRK